MSKFVLAKTDGKEIGPIDGELRRESVGAGSHLLVEVPEDRADQVAKELGGEIYESWAQARESGVIASGVRPGPGGEGVSHHFEGDFGGDTRNEFDETPAEGPAGAGGAGRFQPYVIKRTVKGGEEEG